MSFPLSDLGFPYCVMAVDNGLLCGILLPADRKSDWKNIGVLMVVVQLTQLLLMEGVRPVLRIPLFMLSATLVLAWVSVQTMMAVSWTSRGVSRRRAIFRMYAFTVVGNLDDVLWIGGKIDGRFLQAGIVSALTVPLTIMIVTILADVCHQHRWILAIAAVVTAYAASELYIQTSVFKWVGAFVPAWGNQLLFILTVSVIGVFGLFIKSSAIRH